MCLTTKSTPGECAHWWFWRCLAWESPRWRCGHRCSPRPAGCPSGWKCRWAPCWCSPECHLPPDSTHIHTHKHTEIQPDCSFSYVCFNEWILTRSFRAGCLPLDSSARTILEEQQENVMRNRAYTIYTTVNMTQLSPNNGFILIKKVNTSFLAHGKIGYDRWFSTALLRFEPLRNMFRLPLKLWHAWLCLMPLMWQQQLLRFFCVKMHITRYCIRQCRCCAYEVHESNMASYHHLYLLATISLLTNR